jgi:hypothetical protein
MNEYDINETNKQWESPTRNIRYLGGKDNGNFLRIMIRDMRCQYYGKEKVLI